MPNDDQWMTTGVAKAREKHPLVTEAVSARIAALLNGELNERSLPAARLKVLATALIAEMAPAPPMVEPKQ